VAVEIRAEPGHHRRRWHRDCRGHARHGGGGGAGASDLVEKETKRHVVRWSWVDKDGLGRRRGEHGEDGLGVVAFNMVSISESMRT
jgi:hypothetical protein